MVIDAQREDAADRCYHKPSKYRNPHAKLSRIPTDDEDRGGEHQSEWRKTNASLDHRFDRSWGIEVS